MTNPQRQLKLQAHLDQELSDREAREVAQWLESDPEARRLYSELKTTKGWLAEGELPLTVPESREFYWSKIEKSIQRLPEEQGVRQPRRTNSWWHGFLAPAAGVAIVVLGGLAVVKLTTAPSQLSYLHEIETPREDTSAISFHSQSPAMTVVWVQSQPN